MEQNWLLIYSTINVWFSMRIVILVNFEANWPKIDISKNFGFYFRVIFAPYVSKEALWMGLWFSLTIYVKMIDWFIVKGGPLQIWIVLRTNNNWREMYLLIVKDIFRPVFLKCTWTTIQKSFFFFFIHSFTAFKKNPNNTV